MIAKNCGTCDNSIDGVCQYDEPKSEYCLANMIDTQTDTIATAYFLWRSIVAVDVEFLNEKEMTI